MVHSVAFIYLIICLANGKVYVGSTETNYRLGSHKRVLRAGKHTNRHLQSAYLEYGESSFTFEIVEQCGAEVRFQREQWWVDQLDAANPKFGFNQVNPVRSLNFPAAVMSEYHKNYWAKLSDKERVERVKHLTDPTGVRKGNGERLDYRWKYDNAFKEKVLAGLARAREKTNANPTNKMLDVLSKGRSKAIANNKSAEGRRKQGENALRQYQDPMIREIRLEALARGRRITNAIKRIMAKVRRRAWRKHDRHYQ